MAKLGIMGFAGLSNTACGAIIGDTATGLVATGATQITALPLPSVSNFIGTAAAATGVILLVGSAGDAINVYNGGANALLVYPPVGGVINNLAANTAVSVATLKSAVFVYSAPLNMMSILSA